jgi:hypothetical protein
MRAQELDPHRRHLAEANLLIVQARAHVERQRLLLEKFDTDERPRKAKAALAKSEKTLEGMLRGRTLILEDLNRADIGGIDQPERFRRRANVARAIAHDLNTHETKRLMHRLARSYEQLAAVVESKPAGEMAPGAVRA